MWLCWRSRNERERRVYREKADNIFGLKLVEDSGLLVTSSNDSLVSVFDLVAHKTEKRFPDHSEGVAAMDSDWNCNLLVTGSHDKSICVFDLATYQKKHHFRNATKSHFRCAKILPGENKFFIATNDGEIQLWDLKTKWRIKQNLAAHSCILHPQAI